MRCLIVALVLVSAAFAAAPTAQAHFVTCEMGDMECWLVCRVKHVNADPAYHACRWNVYPPPQGLP